MHEVLILHAPTGQAPSNALASPKGQAPCNAHQPQASITPPFARSGPLSHGPVISHRQQVTLRLGKSKVDLARICCMATYRADMQQMEGSWSHWWRQSTDMCSNLQQQMALLASQQEATAQHLQHLQLQVCTLFTPAAPFPIHAQCKLFTPMSSMNDTHVPDLSCHKLLLAILLRPFTASLPVSGPWHTFIVHACVVHLPYLCCTLTATFHAPTGPSLDPCCTLVVP